MSSSDNGSSILGIIFSIYVAISQIMAFYFWIQYIKSDDSFLCIITIDVLFAELKGLLWIFFI